MKNDVVLTDGRDLATTLFNLAVIRPNDTELVQYKLIGPYLGKKKYHQFIKAVSDIGIELDKALYSRICIEVSKIDGEDYVEVSTNIVCELPIAGKQLPILQRDAEKADMCLNGYIDSLNFIINDQRNFL